ncbi:MAG: trypsin-like peptidase domain-containing protein [Patescibacteria group bacterium]
MAVISKSKSGTKKLPPAAGSKPDGNNPSAGIEPPRQALRTVAIFTITLSVLFGGIAGAVFGAWISTDESAASWIQQNVFGTSSTQSVVPPVGESKIMIVEEESATIDVVETVRPSVVSIVVTQDLSTIYNLTGPNLSPFGDLFSFPGEQAPEGEQEVGAGTGFIIRADGLILTNKHVVATEDAEYTVILNDGEQFDATIIDTDPFNDIALLKIDATDLPAVELGDSDALKIGQTVIAIGNTLGEYQNTVTQGIVSGLSRTVTAGDGRGQSETLEGIVQTDAAINSGNSGGPLLNLDGQVIGVNTAISLDGQLVGFAIPINQAKRSIDSVEEYGRIVRPYLGVRYMLLNEEIAKENNLPVDYGALVVKGSQASDLAIVPGSPADIAGLEENDIILEVDGERITEERSLAKQLQQYNPGDTVTLKLLHDGAEKTVEAVLAEVEE